MIGLLVGLAGPLNVLISGSIYALWIDPKSNLPKGNLRRLL